jgi:hypothetical protein
MFLPGPGLMQVWELMTQSIPMDCHVGIWPDLECTGGSCGGGGGQQELRASSTARAAVPWGQANTGTAFAAAATATDWVSCRSQAFRCRARPYVCTLTLAHVARESEGSRKVEQPPHYCPLMSSRRVPSEQCQLLLLSPSQSHITLKAIPRNVTEPQQWTYLKVTTMGKQKAATVWVNWRLAPEELGWPEPVSWAGELEHPGNWLQAPPWVLDLKGVTGSLSVRKMGAAVWRKGSKGRGWRQGETRRLLWWSRWEVQRAGECPCADRPMASHSRDTQ